jgi:hypothetical protein
VEELYHHRCIVLSLLGANLSSFRLSLYNGSANKEILPNQAVYRFRC